MGVLKDTTIKGVGWSFADSVLGQGITFVVGLVLARLLSPQEYGLIGIITIFISISNSITDSGFSSALIRKNNASDADYNTVFFTNLFFSFIIFGLLYLCAPCIAGFFKESQLVPLLRVMGVVVVINAIAMVQRTIFIKRVDFKTQTKASFVSSVVSGLIGIGMALYGCGVWSLVGQQLSRQTLYTLLLWMFSNWRPKFMFSINSFRELFSFGWKLLVSGMIDTAWKEIYQVVIGRCYSTQVLGQYTRAKQFAEIFSANLTSVVQRVSYPILSSIQDEKERLKQAYQKIIKSTMLVTFTLMLGLAAIAKPMIYVVIGEQWLPCAILLQIVCFNMMMYPLSAINLNMLQVQGRSDVFLKLEIIKKAIGVLPLLLGIFYNIYYMLVGSVFTGFVSYYLNSYYSGIMIGYSFKEQLKDILPLFMMALFMAIVVYAISFLPLPVYVLLLLQIMVGGTLTIFICKKVLRLDVYMDLEEIVLSKIKKYYNK